MNKGIKIVNGYWTSEYDILKEMGDHIVVKLHEPFKCDKDSFPNRHMNGHDIFLIKC